MDGIVFLDRDGTINRDFGYVTTPERMELIPGAARALAELRGAGLTLAMVSNQSAVGRGMATVEAVDATNRKMQELLLAEDSRAHIDFVVYSTDHPDGASSRRKPGIEMFLEIQNQRPTPTECCWMIGDKWSDMEFGIRAGLPVAQCILVKTGSGSKTWESLSEDKRNSGVRTASDLLHASQMILEGLS